MDMYQRGPSAACGPPLHLDHVRPEWRRGRRVWRGKQRDDDVTPWKCQVAPGTAREQVRVARALGSFPLITAEFAAGRLSYAKVRALTRIATPDTEADLVEMATPMTAGQLERFAQAHRRVTREQDQQARSRRKFSWQWVDDFEFSFRGLLPPEEAAVVLQALRAALGRPGTFPRRGSRGRFRGNARGEAERPG
jgi:hypothetical protein